MCDAGELHCGAGAEGERRSYLYLEEVLGRAVQLLEGLLARLGQRLHRESGGEAVRGRGVVYAESYRAGFMAPWWVERGARPNRSDNVGRGVHCGLLRKGQQGASSKQHAFGRCNCLILSERGGFFITNHGWEQTLRKASVK